MRRTAFGLSLLFVLAATDGIACGDKLVQIGRGVRYQRLNKVHPATIVMYVGDSFDRRAAETLRKELLIAGHTVNLVDSRAALASALTSKKSDIVLTDVDSLPAVTEQVASWSTKPTIIPLIERATAAAAELQTRFPFVLTMTARSFDHLAVINRAMK